MLQYKRGATAPVNQPPVAKAGADTTITLPKNSVQLNGSGSSDPEAGIITYGWAKTAGPTQFTLSSTTIVNPVFSNLVAGTYTLRLTVTDNKGAKATDDINVIVNQPPIAKAGADTTITLPKNSVQLNGNGSSDPEAGTITYSWAKTAGPTQFTLSSSTIINPVFSNLVAGTYTLRLTVTDNKGAKATDDINVIVNQPPISKAGADTTITLPKNSVQLNGSGSSDPEAGTITYSWTKTAGPTQFTLSSSTIVNPVFSNLVAGTYTLRLTVTDNKGAKATDDINVIVNQPPIAKAGADTIITLPKNSVQLNGSGSSDPEAGTITYSWAKTAGPTQFTLSSSTIVNPVFSNLVAGTYTLRLTVTDNKGAKATDDINVIVNQPPIAKAGADTTITLPKNSVQLNGSGSSDPEAGTITYSWAKTAGPTQFTLSSSTIVNPVFSNLVAGTYTLRLTVTDNKGAKATDDINVIVNQPPIAKAGADTTITLPKNSVQLNGSGSSDPEAGTITYSWAKTAGPTQFTLSSSTIVNPVFSNLVAGTYTLRLTVTDNKGAKATDDINVIVNPAAVKRPYVLNPGTDEKLSGITSVEIYPNPVTDKIMLQFTNSLTGSMKVQIINSNGAVKKDLVLKHASPVNKVYIPISELPAGAYIIKIQMGNLHASKKIIKL